MDCSLGKKFVSVEGPLTVSGFTVMGWYFLSLIGLRCADCISDQKLLSLVSLDKGSEG